MNRTLQKAAIVLLFLVLLLPWVPAWMGARAQGEDFIIENADGTNTFSMGGSSALTTLIQSVEDRFVLEYANAKNVFSMGTPPSALVTLLQSVEDRFILQYANAKHVFPLASPPSNLVTLLQNAADRFILQYANASYTYNLFYPAGLIGDLDPPLIVDLSIVESGDDLIITIQTNEYTRAQLNYGLEPGVYTVSLEDWEFKFEHTFVVSGSQDGANSELQLDSTYFYQLTLTDRSGNITQSYDLLNPAGTVYVPLVVH